MRDFLQLPTSLFKDRVQFSFIQQLFTGVPPANEAPVTLTGSPFTYNATRKGFAIVQGGTVSMVQFNRTSANYNTGQTQGVFPLSAGDSLIITYSGAPAVTFVPT